MQFLFNTLNHAIEGTAGVAILAAFIWGILSILLSPCHLASIPLIVSFIGEQGKTTAKRAFIISLFFAVGILITIAVVGIITALAGKMLGDIGPFANYFAAIIFFSVALHLFDVFPMPWSAAQPGIKKKGLLAAFLLGLIFGIALGPCTFAYMAPMLAITFKESSSNFLYGIILLFAYGVGHCAVIVIAGTSTELVQNYLNWSSKSTNFLKRICGVLLIIAGLYFIYIA
jgi:cytochrome c-type biogenesis protein